MIVYQSTKTEFLEAAFRRDIEAVMLEAYRTRTGHGVFRQEMRFLGPAYGLIAARVAAAISLTG